MPVIELLPLDKGHRFTLDPKSVTIIGRTPNIGCVDKKISRHHAELYVKADASLWIKPVHKNPTFFKKNDGDAITLAKDEEHQLNDSDQIGLLPNEYFYRISIQSNDEAPSTIPKTPEREKIRSGSSTLSPKSPVKNDSKSDDESSLPSSTREPEGGVILHTKRSLPTWMANGEAAPSKAMKGRGKSQNNTPTKTTPSPSKHRTYIGREKVQEIVYENDDDDEENSNNRSTSTNEAKTSTKREKCPYGKFCYRKNPLHRQQAIHPGDPDWNEEDNADDKTKPTCPYGSACYRKNPDHLKEYSHPKKNLSVKTERTSTKKKRRGSDDEEDDDDGLPNEYDYQDSFIDDAELHDSMQNDRAVDPRADPDQDWKPHRKARATDHHDDDTVSEDDSELELLREEAEEFVRDTSVHQARRAKKKAKLNLHDDEE